MKRMIGLGKQHNGLYYLTPMQNVYLANSLGIFSSLWHQRLGHPSSTPLQVLSKSISEIIYDDNHDCNIFLCAKHTSLPFPISAISSNACLDLIHYDIW